MKQRWNAKRDIRVLGGDDATVHLSGLPHLIGRDSLPGRLSRFQAAGFSLFLFFFFGLVLYFCARWKRTEAKWGGYSRTELYKIELNWNQLPQNLSNLADILANV